MKLISSRPFVSFHAIVKLTRLLQALLIVSGLFIYQQASAQDFAEAEDEENEATAERNPSGESVGRLAAGQLNKARYRLYSGGQDEQDIEVQPVLPTPGRYPDAQPSAASSGAAGY